MSNTPSINKLKKNYLDNLFLKETSTMFLLEQDLIDRCNINKYSEKNVFIRMDFNFSQILITKNKLISLIFKTTNDIDSLIYVLKNNPITIKDNKKIRFQNNSKSNLSHVYFKDKNRVFIDFEDSNLFIEYYNSEKIDEIFLIIDDHSNNPFSTAFLLFKSENSVKSLINELLKAKSILNKLIQDNKKIGNYPNPKVINF